MLKRFLNILSHLLRLLESLVNDLTSVMTLLISQPFHDLMIARRQGKKFKLKAVLLWPLRVVLSMLSVLGRVFFSPAELLVGVFNKRPREWMWTLPWLAGFILLVGMIYSGAFHPEARRNALRKVAIEALRNGEFEEASRHYARLIRQSPVAKEEDLFQYHLALANSGQSKEALEILRELAPMRTPGYAPAHGYIALGIMQKMKRPPDPVTLKALKWHLDNSPESKTPEINRCWAEYYLHVRDPESALRHMKAAASIHPTYMVQVADLYRAMGNRLLQIDALEKAEKQYREILEKEPLVHKTRIMYARIQKDLGRIDSAERTLLTGIDLKNDPEIRSACCGFYLMLFSEEANSALERKLTLLSKALSFDPNHPPAFQALIQFYRSLEDNAPQKTAAIQMLQNWIDDGSATAMVHFALGNILWTEGQQGKSQQLLEVAFRMDQNFAIIANNLAWLLAHSDQPDLERALDLADQASEAQPSDGRIRDTLATILMKQKKFDEALAEFQIALQRPIGDSKTKQVIHEKMAESYRALGKTELANQHDRQASIFKN